MTLTYKLADADVTLRDAQERSVVDSARGTEAFDADCEVFVWEYIGLTLSELSAVDEGLVTKSKAMWQRFSRTLTNDSPHCGGSCHQRHLDKTTARVSSQS